MTRHCRRANRIHVPALGIAAIVIAIITKDVVAALTIAYDIPVGGLLVASSVAGVEARTGLATAASMAVGSVVTLGTMIILKVNAKAPLDGVYANKPFYYGLLASAAAYTAVSPADQAHGPAGDEQLAAPGGRAGCGRSREHIPAV